MNVLIWVSCGRCANMDDISVYLGHTVYEKAVMTDAKGTVMDNVIGSVVCACTSVFYG